MFEQAKGKALYQEVVSQICGMILSGRIRKGQQLPSEMQLCEQMGVSRTTVRGALALLKERNIIETVRGKGSVVVSDDFELFDDPFRAEIANFKNQLENAIQARLLLEPQIARLACRTATKEDLRQMEEVLAVCAEKEKNGTVTTQDLRQFHFRMAQATHNPVLKSMVEMLFSLCDAPPDSKVMLPETLRSYDPHINISHETILEAVRAGSEEDAYFFMKENIRKFYKNTLRDTLEDVQ